MSKLPLKLKADPTFEAVVGIPVAGGDAVDVKFTFRHRTRTQLDEFVKGREGKQDIDSVMDMVQGWDLADEFNRANVTELLENYGGASVAIFGAYVSELIKAKAKN